MQSFLAQSTIQTSEHGFRSYIENRVYHHDTGTKQSIDTLLRGKDASTWTTSLFNEFGRLAQGVGKNRSSRNYIAGTNTIFFFLDTRYLWVQKLLMQT